MELLVFPPLEGLELIVSRRMRCWFRLELNCFDWLNPGLWCLGRARVDHWCGIHGVVGGCWRRPGLREEVDYGCRDLERGRVGYCLQVPSDHLEEDSPQWRVLLAFGKSLDWCWKLERGGGCPHCLSWCYHWWQCQGFLVGSVQ